MFRLQLKPSALLGGLIASLLWLWPSMDVARVDDSSSDSFKVYNSVLAEVQFPGKSPHLLITNKTLNLKCGADSGNPILLNQCSALAISPDTAENLQQLLQENWPRLKKSTWDSFLIENSNSVRLRDAFATPWPHKLAGPDLEPDNDSSPGWDFPSGQFYLSQPGFSSDRAQAVVYVFFVSYTEDIPSSGDYFLLELEKTGWVVKGRVRYFFLDGKGGEFKKDSQGR
jgi:hypothetical protein